jgi:hypothetical protein
MNRNRARYFWGLSLILIGLFFFAVNLEIIPELSANLWAIGFAVLGLIFLAGYFISGLGNWWLLFPGLGSLAIAGTIWLVEADVEGNLAGGFLLLVISLPFWVAFLTNRKANWCHWPHRHSGRPTAGRSHRLTDNVCHRPPVYRRLFVQSRVLVGPHPGLCPERN